MTSLLHIVTMVIIITFSAFFQSADCFVGFKRTSHLVSTIHHHHHHHRLSAKNKVQNQSGKGFGKVIKGDEEMGTLPAAQSQTTDSSSNRSMNDLDVNESNNVNKGNVDEMIQNTDMFKKKRQFQQEALEEKIQRLREEEELLASDPSVGAVPELVANRMLGRIVVFFGIPVFGGLAIFVTAFFASKYYDLTIPPVVIAYATQVPFILGLAGISYAILSSSWDEEDGSKLGFNEFKTNLKRIQDGFARTKSNEILKDDIEKEGNRLQNRRK